VGVNWRFEDLFRRLYKLSNVEDGIKHVKFEEKKIMRY